MGHSSLLDVVLFRGGGASAPAGVAPEALQERGCSCKVFWQSQPVCEVLVSAGFGNISVSLGGAMRTFLAYVYVRCVARRCSRALSPRAWAQLRRSRGALRLVYTPPRRLSAGQRGEVSTTPIERVAKYVFLIELLSGYFKWTPMPRSIRVGSWSRLAHKSAYTGLLGRARSRSLGTEGAKALP
jgi:hypothetical protein